MSDYTKTTNFAAKDSLPSGNSGKIVKGSEIDTEFTNIQTAVATKLDINNSALTGTTTAQTLDISGNVDVDGTLETDALSLNGVTVTSTAAELNILDGVTATTAELNYVDGVTSAIQTQLDAKAPTANPTFTGSFTSPGIDDNATSTAMTLDSSGNVGIGASPYSALTVDTANGILNIANGNTSGGTKIQAWGATPTNGYLVIEGYDKEYMRIDASGNVGIGTSSPASLLTIQDATPVFEVDSTTSANAATIQFTSSGTVDSKITHVGNTGILTIDSGRNSSWGGKIAFVTDTVERMRVDNSGNLLVGRTSTPPTAGAKIAIAGSGDTAIQITKDGVIASRVSAVSTGLAFGVDGSDGATERMRIDSSGNVGIGVTSMDHPLVIQNATPVIQLIDSNATTRVAKIGGENGNVTINIDPNQAEGASFFSVDIDNTERMRINSSGNVGIGTSSATALLEVEAASNPEISIASSGGATSNFLNFKAISHSQQIQTQLKTVDNGDFTSDLAFLFKASGTSGALSEKARIEASGNLSINNNLKSPNDNFLFSYSGGTDGQVRSGIHLEGTNNNIRFYTSQNERARIDSSGNLLVGTTSVPSQSTGVSSGVYFVVKGDIIPSVDAGLTGHSDLGDPSTRYEDAYVRDGVTTGSDGRDKQDIEELSDAEQRVAVACKGLLRKWRWKSSVAEKGDDARIHFGIIAQDLQAAFEAEGLDAGRYAMFINSTWTDEDTGEERSRMGVRYSELLAFIIAAI